MIALDGETLPGPSLAMRGNVLFLAERSSAQRRTVEVGIRGLRDVEILSGLGEDARVISPFPEALEDGARIRVAKE